MHADTDRAGGMTYAERSSIYALETPRSQDQPLLWSLASRKRQTILEIPCGAGRNVPVLERSGNPTIFADLEKRMLDECRAAALASGQPAPRRLLQADLRGLPFRGSLGLILVPAESFQLLRQDADALAALRSSRRALAPNGRVLIDVYAFLAGTTAPAHTAPPYYDGDAPDGVWTDEWERTDPRAGTVRRRRRQFHEPSTLTVEFAYEIVTPCGERSSTATTVRLRRYTASTLVHMARRAGLAPVRLYRDYQGRGHTGVEPRIVALFERSA